MQTSFISENNDVSQSTFLTSSCVMARITANKQIHLSIVCVCVCMSGGGGNESSDECVGKSSKELWEMTEN